MEKKFERRNDGNRNSFFMKDRRENSGREARGDKGAYESETQERRKSFNPNFNKDRVRSYNRDDKPMERNYNRQPREGGYGERRTGGFNRQPREEGFNRDRREQNFNRQPREGGFNRENREHNYNRPFREGGYGERREQNFNRQPREGGFNRERREGGFNREPREGGFNREPRERGFNREPREGGFNRERREGGFNRQPRESGFNRQPREGGYGDRREQNFNRQPREGGFNRERNFNRQPREGGYGERNFNRQPRDSQRPRYQNRIFEGNTKRVGYRGDDTEDAQHGTIVSNFAEPLINREIRLNRYIAMSGICSRREADAYIESGVVSVNGTVVTELGTKVKAGDEVCFNDEVIRGEKKVYIVMNKPKGYVTTLEDPNAEHTVMDLLKDQVEQRVYPVGRLDKNTMGVLLLTNDGDLTKELTHPSYMKKKIYHVFLDKNVAEADMERLAQGIELEDGIAYADEVSYVGTTRKEVGVEIHSGRNRIVRRMFEHFGYKVQKLDRVYFAGLTKKGLQRGMWRYLTSREISMLKSGSYQ